MFPFLIIALLGGAYLLYSKDASAAPDTTPAPASTASLDEPFLAHLRAVGDDLDILKRTEKTKTQIESTLCCCPSGTGLVPRWRASQWRYAQTPERRK